MQDEFVRKGGDSDHFDGFDADGFFEVAALDEMECEWTDGKGLFCLLVGPEYEANRDDINDYLWLLQLLAQEVHHLWTHLFIIIK